MSEWHEVVLGDLIEVLHGVAFKGEFFRSEGPSCFHARTNLRAARGLDVEADRSNTTTVPSTSTRSSFSVQTMLSPR